MTKNYKIEIVRLHHSECTLRYKDHFGEIVIWCDQSPAEDFDYVTSEKEFGVTGDRLIQVTQNIYEWAKEKSITFKIWKESEVGI